MTGADGIQRFVPAAIADDPILNFFHFDHLPPKLQATSKPFFDLAAIIVAQIPRNAERTVALRKLLEAKDAAVRANLPATGASTEKCWHKMIYAEDGELSGKCTQCGEDVLVTGYAQSASRSPGFLSKLPELGQPEEVGGHDEDRDGPVPFTG